jgi:NadR type nicotinamide-nucleotide adenylyltransferase
MEKIAGCKRINSMSAAIQRVVILGAESTGKSTLAAALATHYQTIWVPEYLREFVESRQRTPWAEEQLPIAITQHERETKNAARAHRFLFCDTSPLMTAVYSEYYFGLADVELNALAEQHDYVATIVTAPTTPWMPDGLQRESDAVRQQIHARLLRKLDDGGIAYLLVDGSKQQRISQVENYLAQHRDH